MTEEINSSILQKFPPKLPPMVVVDGKEVDPFEFINSGGRLADINWLPGELVDLVAKHKPKKDEDYDEETKMFNLSNLETAAMNFFNEQPTYINFYQCKQMLTEFGNQWGFAVHTHGWHLCCHYGGERRETKKVATPDRRERKSNKIGCSFVVKVGWKRADHALSRVSKPVYVKISASCFKHTCYAGLESLRGAKKKTGKYTIQDLEQLGTVLDTLLEGNMSAHQLRVLMRKYIPEGVEITSRDIHNLRVRATKYRFENEGVIPPADFDDIINLRPIDEDNTYIRKGSDCLSKEISLILKKAMSERDERSGSWIVKIFLDKIKAEDKYFDYRIWHDPEDDRPRGVAWITRAMRERWLRFGHTLSTDAMKRQLNSLNWHYMAITVHDHENRVGVVIESLTIGEQMDAYAWLASSLFEMEPGRDRDTVTIIFSDCFLQSGFLSQIGLSQITTNLIWDSFHLLSDVFPKALGDNIFRTVQNDLRRMVYSETREGYDEAYNEIVRKLSGNCTAIDFVSGYYSKPHHFAQHFVRQVLYHLNKSSSQGAEANHASVLAHGPRASTQQIELQIELLLKRQNELLTKQNTADFKYSLEAAKKAALSENANDKEALNILSAKGYEWWQYISKQHKKYRTEHDDESGYYSVYYRDNDSPIATIPDNTRCACSQQKAFNSMCAHELSAFGGKFDEALFSGQLKQPQHDKVVPSYNDLFMENDDSIHCDSIAHSSVDSDDSDNQSFEVETNDDEETVDREDEAALPPTPPDDSDYSNSHQNDLDDRKPAAKATNQRIPYGRFREVCSTLADESSKHPLSSLIYGQLVKTLDAVRECRTENEFLEALQFQMPNTQGQPSQDTTLHYTTLDLSEVPKAASVARYGRPNFKRKTSATMERFGGHIRSTKQRKTVTCGFCGLSGNHNVSGCPTLKALGYQKKACDIREFRQVDIGETPSKVKSTQTAWMKQVLKRQNNAVLESIPRETKWLVFHGVHNALNTVASKETVSATRSRIEPVAEVSCYNSFGVLIQYSEQTSAFQNVICEMQAVHDWLSKNCKTTGQKSTRLIIDHKY